jgi:hypothetical protein
MTFPIMSSYLFGLSLMITGTPNAKPVPAFSLVVTTTRAPAKAEMAATKSPAAPKAPVRLAESAPR